MAAWGVLSVIGGVIAALLVAAALFDRRARARGHHLRGGAGIGELREFERNHRGRLRPAMLLHHRGRLSGQPAASKPKRLND